MNETRHPVGLCTIAAADTALSLDQVLTLAAETGFDGVEVWGHPRHLGSEASDQHIQAVRRRCASLGLSVLTYGSYLRLLYLTRSICSDVECAMCDVQCEDAGSHLLTLNIAHRTLNIPHPLSQLLGADGISG